MVDRGSPVRVPADPVRVTSWSAQRLTSYDDTIADLPMDGTGSLITGLGLAGWTARRQGNGQAVA